MAIQPYLFFDGRCDEAIAFYQASLGAEVEMLMRYADAPDPPPPGALPPDSGSRVMHATLKIGDDRLNMSDGQCGGSPRFEGVSLSYTVGSEVEADRVFAALAEGGQVQMPIGTTFFSPRFGMLADRFRVNWMIMTQG